jgi:hypothetical protein
MAERKSHEELAIVLIAAEVERVARRRSRKAALQSMPRMSVVDLGRGHARA